jgi:hypothetical protein
MQEGEGMHFAEVYDGNVQEREWGGISCKTAYYFLVVN